MWVTPLSGPDGYRIEFESYTDVPEETVLAEHDAPGSEPQGGRWPFGGG